MMSAQPLPPQQQPVPAGPDYAAQRALQDQHIQQQILYQQQTSQQQQLRPHPPQMAQTSVIYQPGHHQPQLQYQQQFPALRPVVPQPGTDPTQQYGGQWPHAPAVNTVISVPYTSSASSAIYGQSNTQIVGQTSEISDGGHQLTSHSGHEANMLQDGQHSSNRNG